MQVSQSMKVFRSYDEPIEEHLKYSESMSTLKKLRDAQDDTKTRPASSFFKKGTAEFLQRKI